MALKMKKARQKRANSIYRMTMRVVLPRDLTRLSIPIMPDLV